MGASDKILKSLSIPAETAAPYTPAAQPQTSRRTWSTDLTFLSSASLSTSGSSVWHREERATACSPVPFRQLSSLLPEASSHALELRTCSSLQASECAVSMAETVVCRAAKLQEGVEFLQALQELAEASRLYQQNSEGGSTACSG